MRTRALVLFPFIMLWSIAAVHAGTLQVGALAGNDFIDWSQLSGLGAESGALGTSVPVTTNLGRTATASNTSGTEWFQEGSLWTGDFTIGDYLISSDAQSLVIDFDTAVAGVGAQIQSTAFGNFTAELRLFDSLNNPLGVFQVSGDNNGAEDDSNPFLGAVSDSSDISRAVFAVTANTADFGLGLGQLELRDTPVQAPEPATLALMLLGGGAVVRRRFPRRG